MGPYALDPTTLNPLPQTEQLLGEMYSGDQSYPKKITIKGNSIQGTVGDRVKCRALGRIGMPWTP